MQNLISFFAENKMQIFISFFAENKMQIFISFFTENKMQISLYGLSFVFVLFLDLGCRRVMIKKWFFMSHDFLFCCYRKPKIHQNLSIHHLAFFLHNSYFVLLWTLELSQRQSQNYRTYSIWWRHMMTFSHFYMCFKIVVVLT